MEKKMKILEYKKELSKIKKQKEIPYYLPNIYFYIIIKILSILTYT